MELTTASDLEKLLLKSQEQIATFWACTAQPGFSQIDCDKKCLSAIFSELNDINAECLWSFACNGNQSIENIYSRSIDTSTQFISGIVSWSNGKESKEFSPALRNLINNTQSVPSSLYSQLPRFINEELAKTRYTINGYALSCSEIRVLLDATPPSERNEIWSQLAPQLKQASTTLIKHLDAASHELVKHHDQFNPLRDHYEIESGLLNILETSSNKLLKEYSLQPPSDTRDIYFKFDIKIGLDVVRDSYTRYLPAFLPALDSLITRTEVFIDPEAQGIKWPFNVHFDSSRQHKIYLPSDNSLENLFDLAHHVGHALHQDLTGGDGVYNGVIAQSLNEVLPLLSEHLLQIIIPSYFKLNASDSAAVHSHAMKRMNFGVLQPWQTHHWQRELLALSASNKLDYSSMTRLWGEYFPHQRTEYIRQQTPLLAWLLDSKPLFQFPAVSSNALGGIIASILQPNLLNEPQHYSAILLEQMIAEPRALIRIIDSFQTIHPSQHIKGVKAEWH